MANNKLMILAVTLAALVVLTQATFKKTLITTEVESEYDTSNPRQSEQCESQLKSHWPNMCEKFMKQTMRRRGRAYDDEVINPRGVEGQFDQCCNELKMMRPQCQCEAMEMMMDMMPMGRSHMMDMPMMMPMMCGTMERKCPMPTM